MYFTTYPEDYERKELYGSLETIQLLVIPDTEKLLREKNRALEVEYPWKKALTENIQKE